MSGLAWWFVEVEGVKEDGKGAAGGSEYVQAANLTDALVLAVGKFERTWKRMGYPDPVTYNIVAAGESSPHRSAIDRPLPVRRQYRGGGSGV